MTDLENYPSSLFYASDFLKDSWQVRDDIGVSSWVSSNNCTSSPLLWGVGTLVIDSKITMQSGWLPRPPSKRAGWPEGNEFNCPYPSLSPQEGRLGGQMGIRTSQIKDSDSSVFVSLIKMHIQITM